MKKSPDAIDKHVGSRVRLRRMLNNMSQEKLGKRLGITFQQIQKYEKGTNRIGASRLQQIANVLGVPVSAFFEGSPGGMDGTAKTDEASEFTALLTTPAGLDLARAFTRVKDPAVRKQIVQLVQAIALGGK